jgi:hypothetical protein
VVGEKKNNKKKKFKKNKKIQKNFTEIVQLNNSTLQDTLNLLVQTEQIVFGEGGDHIDQSAAVLAEAKLKGSGRVPLRTHGEGNCLFNSVSVALMGVDAYATLLRVACTADLLANKQRYMDILMQDPAQAPAHLVTESQTQENENEQRLLALECGDIGTLFDIEVRRMSKNYQFAGVLYIWSLANVLQRPVESFSPGPQRDIHKVTNKVYYPFEGSLKEPLCVMWSRVVVKKKLLVVIWKKKKKKNV